MRNGSIWLFLDNELIVPEGTLHTAELKKNEEYILHWFVRGNPGSKYSINVSSPMEAEFRLTTAVDRTGKDYGGLKFTAGTKKRERNLKPFSL
jgi:hypothetical protein